MSSEWWRIIVSPWDLHLYNSQFVTWRMNKKENKDPSVAEKPLDFNGDRVTYSFRVNYCVDNYCVDNYFRAIVTIFKLCGEDDGDYALQQTKIQHLFASLTFLR